MAYLTQHWSVDPFLIVVLVLVVWRRPWSLWFYSGLVVLAMILQGQRSAPPDAGS
jgi:hypothetical protein